MNMNMSSSEDMNAFSHDVIASGRAAEQKEVTLQ